MHCLSSIPMRLDLYNPSIYGTWGFEILDGFPQKREIAVVTERVKCPS